MTQLNSELVLIERQLQMVVATSEKLCRAAQVSNCTVYCSTPLSCTSPGQTVIIIHDSKLCQIYAEAAGEFAEAFNQWNGAEQHQVLRNWHLSTASHKLLFLRASM
jgi:hypothetical protein